MTRGRAALPTLAALAFVAAWLVVHDPLPIPVDADLYTHLTVARHLVQGDGFQCDIAYPLSAAFEWGRQLPQPLMTRQPAFAVLLTVPYLAAGRGPASTLDAVWFAQVALLGLAAWGGVRALARRRALAVAPAWLLVLLASPLLHLAASWGWTEIAAGVALLLLWLRWRDRRADRAPRRTVVLDGVLAGLVALLRLDLAWVPMLWWVLLNWGPGAAASRRARSWPATLRTSLLACTLAAGGWLLVMLPWLIRTTALAGSPFFTLQAHAYEASLGEQAWSFSLLRGLEPSTLGDALGADPVAVWLKLRHGIRFFAETLGQWLPWTLWAAAALIALLHLRRRTSRGHSWLAAAGTSVTLAITLALVVVEYALFSHEARHLLVLLPVVSWELAALAAAVASFAAHRLRHPLRVATRALIPLAVVVVALVVTPPTIGGEQAGIDAARRDAPRARAAAAAATMLPRGPAFADAAVLAWLTGRPVMWSPTDQDVEQDLRRLVPSLRDAPWLTIPR